MRREDVEDRAAHRERARVLDDGHTQVAAFGEQAEEGGAVEALFDAHDLRACGDGVPRRDASRDRGRGGHEEAPGQPFREVEEGGQAVHRGAPIGRDIDEGRRVRRRVDEDVRGRIAARARVAAAALDRGAGEEAQIPGEPPRRVVVGDEHEQTLLGAERREPREQQGTRARRQAAQVDAAGLPDPRGHVGERRTRTREPALERGGDRGVGVCGDRHGGGGCRARVAVPQRGARGLGLARGAHARAVFVHEGQLRKRSRNGLSRARGVW